MTRNIVHKSVAPLPPHFLELVDTPPAGVPFALGGIWLHLTKYFWLSPDDFMHGRKLMAQLGARLLMTSGQDIVNAIDRLYNLQDAAHFSIERDVTGEGTEIDPFVYDPVIPQVHTIANGHLSAVDTTITDLRDSSVNFQQGTIEGAYTDVRNPRDMLAAIQTALETLSTDDEASLEQLVQIVALLGV